MDILKRIKRLQSERGWTTYKLSEEAGLPTVTVSNMFSRGTMPSIATLTALCGAFDMTLSQFFSEDENEFWLSDGEKELIAGYRKLDKKCKHAVGNLIDELKD